MEESRGSVERCLWKLAKPGVRDEAVGAILRERAKRRDVG
jgi:hypothetical protein